MYFVRAVNLLLVIKYDILTFISPELNIVAFQPWTGLKIPSKVDNALEQVTKVEVFKIILTCNNSDSEKIIS